MVTAACSSSSGLVATVGVDGEITQDDLAALYETNTLPVDEELRQAIFGLIAYEVLVTAMEADFGFGIDEAGVEDLFTQISLERDSYGISTADFLGVPNAGEEMLRFDASLAVLKRQVVNALASDPEYIDAVMELPTLFTTVCAAHILVATEEEATTVIDRLGEGEAFAAVADEVSLDTGVGGDLGCRVAGTYVTQFADATVEAPLNEVFGPVETEFGWHVLLVTERTAPTREEVAADPIAILPVSEANALWQEWFNGKLQEAEVVVEPKYGTWSPVGILPPS